MTLRRTSPAIRFVADFAGIGTVRPPDGRVLTVPPVAQQLNRLAKQYDVNRQPTTRMSPSVSNIPPDGLSALSTIQYVRQFPDD
jgi:hypothetical protein